MTDCKNQDPTPKANEVATDSKKEPQKRSWADIIDEEENN
jgi:hypothetical protein